ncbi:hypothetical protein T492DRAFT_973894 [Pavlovales sp. CCMP2436]|nr:hypothetical protein T492DRAFT_973894 [Pavlovales sp. CCMP2436]
MPAPRRLAPPARRSHRRKRLCATHRRRRLCAMRRCPRRQSTWASGARATQSPPSTSRASRGRGPRRRTRSTPAVPATSCLRPGPATAMPKGSSPRRGPSGRPHCCARARASCCRSGVAPPPRSGMCPRPTRRSPTSTGSRRSRISCSAHSGCAVFCKTGFALPARRCAPPRSRARLHANLPALVQTHLQEHYLESRYPPSRSPRQAAVETVSPVLPTMIRRVTTQL